MHFNLSFPGNQTHHLRFSSGTCYLSFLPVATFHVRRTRGASHDYLPTRMSLALTPLEVCFEGNIEAQVTRLPTLCQDFSLDHTRGHSHSHSHCLLRHFLWITVGYPLRRAVSRCWPFSSGLQWKGRFQILYDEKSLLSGVLVCNWFSNSRVEFPKFSLRLAERVLGDYIFSNDFQNGLK